MSEHRRLNWRNLVFIAASPVAAGLAVGFYAARQGFHAGDLVSFTTMMLLTGFSITAGYHRYFSHRSYECHRVLQGFYLLFGAAALQAPALKWVLQHRDHHRFVDQERDPYNAKKGFFWAHLGWTLYRDDRHPSLKQLPDLAENRLLVAQDRHHLLLGLGVGLGVPFLIGLAFGRPLGGVLWGGLLRIVAAHHGTFLINSVGHFFGRQPYSRRDSSRDSALLAVLTLGEGFHNFHHAFPGDYRNGVRWYHWDPTKWWICTLRALGLAWRLNRTPMERVRRLRRALSAGTWEAPS